MQGAKLHRFTLGIEAGAPALPDAQPQLRKGLLEHEDLIGLDVVLPALFSVGPDHADVDGRRVAQAEVRFERVVRGVVVGSAHRADLCPSGRPCFDQGADAGGVRSQRRDLDRQVVVVVVGIVSVVDDVVRAGIGDDDIDVAVALGVEAGDAPALPGIVEAEIRRAFLERAIAL